MERNFVSTPDTTCHRLGPIWLAPGITRINAITYLYGDSAVIGFLIFINIGQAYVLNENLGIPRSEQGTITGDLAFWSEITVLLIVGGFGVVSDRIGRRAIFAFGLAMIGLAYLLYPIAHSIGELTAYRLIYAVGVAAATVMLSVVVHDYPQEISRGKLVALSGIMGGLGSLTVMGVFGRLPAFFTNNGADAISAGQYTLWLASTICMLSAGIMLLGLKGGTPATIEQRPSITELLRSGIREAKNPRIALAYGAAFESRADMVTAGMFVILWGTIEGRAQGLETPEAVGRAALLSIASTIGTLLWAPVMGFIMDRVNRVTALIIGSSLASVGYLSMVLIDNPLDRTALPLFVLLGIGQSSFLFATQSLIGQEAPKKERGAVIGTFSMFGALGVLIAALIGGRLFDAVSPVAPFVLVGCCTALVLLASIFVRIKAPGRMPSASS